MKFNLRPANREIDKISTTTALNNKSDIKNIQFILFFCCSELVIRRETMYIIA